MMQISSKSSPESAATRTDRLGSEITKPSRCSIRSASLSGVRPAPNSPASLTCAIVAPAAISPRKIAVRSRS